MKVRIQTLIYGIASGLRERIGTPKPLFRRTLRPYAPASGPKPLPGRTACDRGGRRSA